MGSIELGCRMKKYFLLVAVFCMMTMGAGRERAQTATDKPVVVRLDPALDEFVSPNAELQVVKSGFGFTEGLTWVQQGKTGYLLFSDIPANVVDKMTPDGTVSVFVDESGYRGPWNGYTMENAGHLQNNGKDPKDPLFRQFNMIGSDGLTLDPQGRLLICTFSGRSLDRVEKNGKRVVLVDRYEGKKLNGPNDVVVKKDGAVYFTDTFAWRLREKDPSTELDHLGIYMLKDGKVKLVIKDIPSPNGLAFSPDEKYLYANGGGDNYINRYDVQPDDTVTNGQLLIDLSVDKSAPGITDGMRVDSKGNIWSSGPGGLWIISPEGKHLGTILIPERFANLSFGDADDKTVYIGGRTNIYKIRANITGSHY
jgi:gluconolactonase